VRDAAPAATSTAVISLCSTPRVGHLRNQLAALAGGSVSRIVVWVGDDDPSDLDAEHLIYVPPGRHGLRLAAARNAGANAAIDGGAQLLVFLDADCVPGPDLVLRYAAAAAARPDAVLCGPVTYLPPGADVSRPSALAASTRPHPARPDPPATTCRTATDGEYALFWSLSFALTALAWTTTDGFDEGYEGYGGEDTDFAFRLRSSGIPLVWVGGAHAYHQHHDTQSPPWQHLDDILRNAVRFHGRWGEWPMTGWLDAFADARAIEWDGQRWTRAAPGADTP